MSCISAHDPQLARLADAIAQRVGPQRFHVWFNNSTRLDLKQDGLEIAVPNDFISEWIGRNFAQPIQDAAREVLGCSLRVRFNVVPQLFEIGSEKPETGSTQPVALQADAPHRRLNEDTVWHSAAAALTATIPQPAPRIAVTPAPVLRESAEPSRAASAAPALPRLRHSLTDFVVGPSNQLAYNAAQYVAEFPGLQYNPLFIHGSCGLGKTHLLQGICKRFIEHHPTKRWMYFTGEEYTNEFLVGLRHNKLDAFRRRVRDLDLLVIDDVHFLGGKRATQEEFLHTFNAIEAMGKQIVMASDHHPKLIEEFSESLINRFVSGMVVRIDPPNFNTRCQILRNLLNIAGLQASEEMVAWVARRVTQNVRELEGAVTRIGAHSKLIGQQPDMAMIQEALGDLERQLIAPVKPDNILGAVCGYFGLEMRDLMSGRRQRTISLARSIAMYLVRKTAKLSFPEIGMRMGNRNHSTVISACRRMEQALEKNEKLTWTSSIGERSEEALELVQRLEELSRVRN
ncbi:MAG: chromosomal replication initiator protein DnaA [Bacillota bacterium]